MVERVKTMALAGKAGEGRWILNDKFPVVFGTGSVLNFLETNLEAGEMSLNEALCEVRRFEQQPELVIITQRR